MLWRKWARDIAKVGVEGWNAFAHSNSRHQIRRVGATAIYEGASPFCDHADTRIRPASPPPPNRRDCRQRGCEWDDFAAAGPPGQE